ncbi:unnamed protein product [Closterium sp. Yama58-4]|nr:unnamed protein product [Closterium sp. Yama58-4]
MHAKLSANRNSAGADTAGADSAGADSAGAVFAPATAAPLPLLPPVRFNQDDTCFTYATHSGFHVFCCDPLKETIQRREFEGRGVGKVEMLFRSNLLALVGSGLNPWYPPNKVRWGEERGEAIGEPDQGKEVTPGASASGC